jgi:hypothetical protein
MGNYNISYNIKVQDQYSQPLDNFNKGLKAVDETAKKVSRTVNDKLSSSFKGLGKGFERAGKFLAMRVSAPLTAFALGSLKAAADVEYLHTSLKAFTGSGEVANKVLKQLKDTSNNSIFSLGEIGGAARLLLGVGYSADEVNTKIKQLSDVAATFNIPLEFMADQLEMVKQQKAFGLHQAMALAKQGVPVFKELAGYVQRITGRKYNDKQIKTFLQEGRISAKAFEGVLEQLTSKGGVAFKGMENNTNNLHGAFLRLKNSAGGFLEGFGEELAKTTDAAKNLDKMAVGIEKVTVRFREWASANPTMVKNLTVLGGVLVGLPPILIAVGWAFKALAMALAANPIIAIITGIVMSVTYLLSKQQEISAFIDKYKNNVSMPEYDRQLREQMGMKNYSFSNYMNKKHGLLKDEVNPLIKNDSTVGIRQGGMSTVSSAEVNINLNDPGKFVKSVDSRTSGFSGFNFGVNNLSPM